MLAQRTSRLGHWAAVTAQHLGREEQHRQAMGGQLEARVTQWTQWFQGQVGAEMGQLGQFLGSLSSLPQQVEEIGRGLQGLVQAMDRVPENMASMARDIAQTQG